MPDRLETFSAECRGGLIQNEHSLSQGINKPGSAIELINYEPALSGGYRRINGYTKFDTNAVTGSGDILGCKVFNGGVVACRNDKVFFSTGSGWVQKNTTARTSAGRYQFDLYNMAGSQTLAMADGVNKPAKWDGTTWTDLTNAPTATKSVAMFKGHLFCAYGKNVAFSAPGNDNDFAPANGAGDLSVSDDVIAVRVFRENVIVFCKNRILRITGNNNTDFQVIPITNNIGAQCYCAIQEIDGDLIFMAPDGLRPISATDRIGDFEIGNISRQVHQLLTDIGTTSAFSSAVVRSKTQYRLFPLKASQTAAQTSSVIGAIRRTNEGSKEWEWGELRGFKVTYADSGYINSVETIIHGDSDGFIFKQEQGNSFDGGNIVSVYRTPNFPINDPALRKTLHHLHVYVKLEGLTDIQYDTVLDYLNEGVLQPPSGSLTLSQTTLSIFDDPDVVFDSTWVFDGLITPVLDNNLIGSGTNISFRFTTDDQNPAHTIQAFIVEYNTQGRR